VNVPAGINLNFMPIELVDSANLTGVALVAVGGVSAEMSLPQITTTATQTAIDLKIFTLASLVRDELTLLVRRSIAQMKSTSTSIRQEKNIQ
jgi:hypothetical protein